MTREYIVKTRVCKGFAYFKVIVKHKALKNCCLRLIVRNKAPVVNGYRRLPLFLGCFKLVQNPLHNAFGVITACFVAVFAVRSIVKAVFAAVNKYKSVTVKLCSI